MFSGKLLEDILSIESDLEILESVNDSDGWSDIANRMDSLTESLTGLAEFVLADASVRCGVIFGLLCNNVISDAQEAYAHSHRLLSVIVDAAKIEDFDQSEAKEAIAAAELYISDISKANEVSKSEVPEIDPEFIAEIESRVEGVEHTLVSTKEGENDFEYVKAIFREYHTLKGEAGIIGLKELADFWHGIESPIECARDGSLTLSKGIIDSLLELTKYGRIMLKNGLLSDDDMQKVEKLKAQLVAAVELSLANPSSTVTNSSKPLDDNNNNDEIEDDDDFFAEALEADVANEGIIEVTDNIESDAVEESEPEVESEFLPEDNNAFKRVQVDVTKLDELLELVGEVSLVGSHLAGHKALAGIPEISSELQELLRFCRTLGDMAATFRMTSIAPLFKRVQRAGMEAARSVNKRIEFKIEGVDTKVDRLVVERLNEALVHLVRNSVDHGLESQEVRRELGKNAVGEITLKAFRSGADVIVQISDDGQGIDLQNVVETAKNNGLLNKSDELTEGDILSLIFSSGLSTATKVTGLSGRGVGMSVVSEAVDALRGRIEMDNSPGRGVTFSISFPVALAAVEALLVTLGDNIVALPVQSVKETFRVEKNQLSTVEGRGTIINIRGVVVPLINLGEYLSLPGNNDVNEGVVILVDEGGKLAAVLVDDVMETRQVVIRQLEGALKEIKDITGAALLSGREVALVLDMRSIIENTFTASAQEFENVSSHIIGTERQVETVSIGSNAVGMIDFSVDSREDDGTFKRHVFAINAFKTKEFIPVEPLIQIPDVPKGFAGMLSLRDKSIPVMSLDILLGFNKSESRDDDIEKIIVICEFSGVTVGFIVTEVCSVSYISWDDIKPPPHGGTMFSLSYVIGTIELSSLVGYKDIEDVGDVAFVLDFEQIVQSIIDIYGEGHDELGVVQMRKDNNRVLLVEDSPLILRQTAEALEKSGIEVVRAENGLEAQMIIEDYYRLSRKEGKSIFHYLDLILSDIEMPQMDGYSLASFVKNHPDLRLLPFLLHSSLTNDSIVKRAKEVHADGFVPKCDPAQLAESLKKYL